MPLFDSASWRGSRRLLQFGSGTGGVGTAVTNGRFVSSCLSAAAVGAARGNLPTGQPRRDHRNAAEGVFDPAVLGHPGAALTPVQRGYDSFVGERERASLEPLPATPIETSAAPVRQAGRGGDSGRGGHVAGCAGLLGHDAAVALDAVPAGCCWPTPTGLFSLLVVTPLVAGSTPRVWWRCCRRAVSATGVAYQLNGLDRCRAVLLLRSRATAFLFLVTPFALAYLARRGTGRGWWTGPSSPGRSAGFAGPRAPHESPLNAHASLVGLTRASAYF